MNSKEITVAMNSHSRRQFLKTLAGGAAVSSVALKAPMFLLEIK